MVETSAVLACCLGETGDEPFELVLTTGAELVMSAPTRLKLGMIALNRNIQARVEEAMLTYQIQIEPLTPSQVTLAIAAFAQYGKGRHNATTQQRNTQLWRLLRLRASEVLEAAPFILGQ